MQIDEPLALLGGLAPATFMRRHWQKTPLLIRQALPGVVPAGVAELYALAARDDVESRLVVQAADGRWRLRRGPLPRRAIPPASHAGWTVLVQGLDLHVPAARALLDRFRFVPDARLDDLMVSIAGDGGGVGPHLDSYDVFLLQVQGRRRWRVGRVPRPQWRDDVPLKMLARFEPEHEWLLEPGDLLYLPPLWGHDGIAVGPGCMTCSIGFRAPQPTELARDLLQRIADFCDDEPEGRGRYRDRAQPATSAPGRMPDALAAFAADAVQRVLRDPDALACALGESLTEPKPAVWFDSGGALQRGAGLVLDRRTRMLYDERHVYINGESLRAAGRDATLMRELADQRRLPERAVAAASAAAREVLADWAAAGWLHSEDVA